MSSTPSTDAEWAAQISKMKEWLPARSVSQPPIPLGIHRMIDHTLLKEPIAPEQIDTICKEAHENNFAAVCVRLGYVARAVANLKDVPGTVVACVVGFPEGTHETADKVREAKEAVEQGASELDMVIKYELLQKGMYTAVYDDIVAVRQAAPAPITLKTIVEVAKLDKDQLMAATIVCCMAGADFVKTSTGFNGGASVQHISLMRVAADMCGRDCKIKASGGIRSAEDCVRMVKAGAQRIGTSSGVRIVTELNEGELLEQGASHAVS
ncbi:hypothetical protein NUU61_000487 [Penicillium alfredii]|uniref:deoxyribose-phosphate aldolase n=1 Tax=Penicillium alfredii TaxID=1506179 RepID=A0A9W9G9T0_9EURO|nr:uncharacterized protein NUU61_000487 [Penicillium alfredii]KAJ5114728.1 hypothetical protein NUU61_000487 [Penicillium alfredii]